VQVQSSLEVDSSERQPMQVGVFVFSESNAEYHSIEARYQNSTNQSSLRALARH
jgi:hypothetical protein